MRQFDPGFSHEAHGFANFRALLEAAEAQGLVRTYRREGVSDVLVSAVSAAGEAASGPTRRTWLRQDLWRAVLDHQSGATHAYNRDTRTTTVVADPASVAEPNVVVPSVTAADMLEWMRQFADEQSGLVRTVLLTTLEGEEPVRAFEAEVRRSSSMERRWRRALRGRVTQRVGAWAQQNEIPGADLETEVPEVPRAHEPAATVGGPVTTGSSDPELREQILRAVSAMPLSELLKLAIPVEYVLRR